MICPNCGKENKNTNIRCDFCSTELINVNELDQKFASNGNIVETKEVKSGCLCNVIFLILVGPWLFFGILFLGFGLYATISEHNQAKEYEETIGVLKSTSNVGDDGLCNATYEYQVNGNTYLVSPNMSTNCEKFDESATVYYNPDNPKESIMYTSRVINIFIIDGLVIIIVVIVLFVLKNIVMKKLLKGKKI